VQVQLDALPGRNFAARVQALDPLLDVDGRSIAVRATLAATAGKELRPGMFARVLTVFAVDEAALVVPEEAIVPQGGKQFVILIETEGEGDAVKRLSRRVEVQLGVRRGAQVQVTSGLKAGDTVVVAGQQRLQKDGTAVRVVEAGGGAAPANIKTPDKAQAVPPAAAAANPR
jgi:membrane fusion protein (multidrug efflux system)